MARVTSPRPSSRQNTLGQPRKLFIRISADKMRWYKTQEAREREASRASCSSSSSSSSSSTSSSPRRVRISLKRRDSS
ncbi:hypothetical protein J7T55_003359 [Diaporthe amygdali]|uniref:uncharacterized protein n=1 Tax=Phomopsis amygdali TaxID=1214568 RepID=UPI0022FEB7F6|nr:uncharacterized protein J7T55_003359 [Diaporthe amygdali]KAJ0116945.1 hypothetical protein J7T55_003359 [Diaporthe amygdali]